MILLILRMLFFVERFQGAYDVAVKLCSNILIQNREGLFDRERIAIVPLGGQGFKYVGNGDDP